MTPAQRLAAWIARVEYAATFLAEGRQEAAEDVLRRGLTEVGADAHLTAMRGAAHV